MLVLISCFDACLIPCSKRCSWTFRMSYFVLIRFRCDTPFDTFAVLGVHERCALHCYSNAFSPFSEDFMCILCNHMLHPLTTDTCTSVFWWPLFRWLFSHLPCTFFKRETLHVFYWLAVFLDTRPTMWYRSIYSNKWKWLTSSWSAN